MRCLLALLLPLAISPACFAQTPVPSEATAAPLFPVVFEVADTEQFCPTTWRLRIDVPPGGPFGLHGPSGRFQLKVGDGQWAYAEARAQGGVMPAEGFFPCRRAAYSCGGGAVGIAGRWQFGAGEFATFAGDVADWRVLAVPGTYRIHAWLYFADGSREEIVRGARGTGGRGASDVLRRPVQFSQEVISSEFQVRAAGADGATLRQAMADDSELWKAYQRFMDPAGDMGLVELDMPRPHPFGPTPPEGARFFQALMDARLAPCDVLSRSHGLPTAVRDRVELVLAKKAGLAATLAQKGPEDAQAEGRLVSDYRTVGTKGGFVGAFARLQTLVYMNAYGNRAEFESMRDAARQDRELLEFGLCFPEAMGAVGLMTCEILGSRGAPAPAPPAGGSGGPWRRVGW